MNKSDLLSFISGSEMTDDVKSELQQYLSTFPDALSKEDLVRIDQHLVGLQQEEFTLSGILADAGKEVESYLEASTNNFADATMKTMEATKSTLEDLNSVVDPS